MTRSVVQLLIVLSGLHCVVPGEHEDILHSVSKANIFVTSDDVSEKCRDNYQLFLDTLTQSKQPFKDDNFWAFKTWDAYGKLLNSGELLLNAFHLGSYTSCLEVAAPQGQDFKGKFCHIYTVVANVTEASEENKADVATRGLFTPFIPPFQSAFGQDIFKSYLAATISRFSICLPSSCTTDEISLALSDLSKNYSTDEISVVVQPLSCETADSVHTLDGGDIAMICILGAFILICFIGTMLEVLNRTVLQRKFDDMALLSYSIGSSFQKLMSTETKGGHITCLDGIRFFSISWVLVGHIYSFLLNFPFSNLIGFSDQVFNDVMFRAVLNAFISVDSFFFLSGLLLTFLTLKEMDKRNGKINLPLFYFHRYVRLTAVYGLVVGFHATLYRYFAFGPSNFTEAVAEICRESWWQNILYINNLRLREICLDQSWYVSVDMQMFVVSPFVILPLWHINNRKGFYWALGYVSAWIATFTLVLLILCLVEQWPATPLLALDNVTNYMEWNYTTPWCRCQPYLVGILFGFFLHITKDKDVKLSSTTVIGLWSAAFAAGLAIMYSVDGGAFVLTGETLSLAENVVYGTFHRLGWGLCLGWIVFASYHGYGGWINSFLSWKGFMPLSRLTFAIYLVHLSVLYAVFSQFTFNAEASHLILAVFVMAVFVISTIISAMIVIFLEIPSLHIEKQLLSLATKKKRSS